jgi:hypothetical protein
MEIVEIPNAIPRAYQDQVESELASPQMLWTFQEEIARGASKFATSFGGFSHMAYLTSDDEPIISPMSSLLLPILFVFCDKANLEFRALLRIRIGLFPRTISNVAHHNPHIDFGQPHRTAVYYVNDCDGDTVIFNETVGELSVERSVDYANAGRFSVAATIPPKKGKMACFDGRHYHASSYPTEAAKRIVVTFNFV